MMRKLALLSLTVLALLPGCDRSETSPSTSVEPAGKCDAAKVAALTEDLAAAKPGDGPELVAQRLGEVCELPPVLAGFFAEAAERAEKPGSLRWAVVGGGQAAHAALTEICPDATAIRKQLPLEPGALRQGVLFERCDLQRFGLIDKDAWLEGNPYSAVPFFAYHWLTEQGAADPDANALATAMILHDRKRWSLEGQTLPTAANALAVIPDGAPVYVTPTSVEFGLQSVANVIAGEVDPAAREGHLIAPLFDVMAGEAERAKQSAASRGDGWEGTFLLVADAATHQRTVLDVLATARRAGYRRCALVAQSAPFEFGAVLVDIPMPGVSSTAGDVPEFAVHVGTNGFELLPSTPDGAKATIALSPGAQHDFAALSAAAKAHKDANPTATVARVDAEPSTTFAVLVNTLAALNGADCHESVKACLLPDLIVQIPEDPKMTSREAEAKAKAGRP